MGSVGQAENPHTTLKSYESFYKWFIPIQNKSSSDGCNNNEEEPTALTDYLFNGNPPTIRDNEDDEEEEDDEQDGLSLIEKRTLELVKKCIRTFREADVLLELAEDERVDSDFSWKFRPLEPFAALGGEAFFNIFAKNQSESSRGIERIKDFVKRYTSLCKEEADSMSMQNVNAMHSVLRGLEMFYTSVFPYDASVKHQNYPDISNHQDRLKVLGIKLYFLQHFEKALDEREVIVDKLLAEDTSETKSEWNLNRYFIKRQQRLNMQISSDQQIRPSEDEKREIETALKKDPHNPWNVLGGCQFLTDFIAGHFLTEMEFAGKKFDKHSDMFNYIKDTSVEITNKYPSFLRANFTFVEIFANDLPITRQDKEFARSFLDKALNANPDSSKICFKMGMFLVKGRQFSEAKNYLQRSIKLNPKNVDAYYSLAKLLLRDPNGISTKETAESFFNFDVDEMNETLGPENQMLFWKGCYFFATGDKDLAVGMWVEVILEFYVSKPELDLETVVPFHELIKIPEQFFWMRSPLTLANIEDAVKNAANQEKTRRRVVLNRLLDLVTDAKMLLDS